MFSFNLLAFEGLSAPTQMTPARDRLLGILLGLIVMFLIFHQVRPERTVDTMRQNLARLLRSEAELVRLTSVEPPGVVPSPNTIQLRIQLEHLIASIRSLSDVVKYEFEPDRSGVMAISQEILNAVSTSASLLLSLQAWPDTGGIRSGSESLKQFRVALENGLRDLARSLELASGDREELREHSARLLEGPQLAEPKSVGKTLDSFRELQMLCEGIATVGA